ncbi:exonuclease, partial [Thraustotheca clavata]
STILNYHTEFSGITEEALANVKVHLEDVQTHLLTLFNQRTILVGHSLDSDLKALRLVHLRVADTAILYPHHRGFPFKPSLKTLARTFLQETIQDQAEGHDSAQDAITALKLFQLKVKEGVCFGLPTPPVFSRAYTTLLEQIPDSSKHFCTVGAPPLQKPWVLHASGALNDLLNNTITNVNAQDVSVHDVLPPADHVLYTKDLMWLEMDINGNTDPKLYMETLHLWQRQQVASIQALNTMLSNLYENVPQDTLVLVLPQADLGIYRYMKAVRMKSRWDAWDSQWTDSDQFNLQYAYSGLLDSCLFLKQK